MEKTICDGRSWCGLGSWFGGVALEGFHVWGLLVEVAAHLFLICHGQATPSLISYAYSFTCAPIFLSFLILQSFVPLVLGLFLFLFFGENVELFDFMGFFFFFFFLCVCFPRKFIGLWVCWGLVCLLDLWVWFIGEFNVVWLISWFFFFFLNFWVCVLKSRFVFLNFSLCP